MCEILFMYYLSVACLIVIALPCTDVWRHDVTSRWKRNNFAQRGGQGRGRGRGRNNFGRGRGRGRGYVRKGPVEKSAEQLDKELDSYHSGAMNVD